MEERRATLRVERDDPVEVAAFEVAVRPGRREETEQHLLVPGLRDASRDDLLGKDVERPGRLGRTVEHCAPNAAQERRRLDQLVQREREEAALRDLFQRVSGAPHPLEKRGDRARGAHLDDEVDVADVDPELERRGGDERAKASRFQTLLGVQAPRPREAAVMARDRVFPQDARQLCGDPLRHLARVDEDESRPVLPDELRDPLVDLGPLLVRAHGRERRRRDLDSEVEVAESPGVDERALPPGAGEEAADRVDRLLRGGEADALDRPTGELFETLEGQRQMAPPLVAHEGVDLVHDHGPNGREHSAPAVAG